jgi:hypothetical protein
MQIDMHYYGTYCLARAAGIKKESAYIIAYTAQFVDDNIAAHVNEHDDGSKIFSVPTAHHAGNIKNRKPEDQRLIWVPFHFIPGNDGDTFTERLVCQKDSAIAQEMVAHNITHGHKPFGLELLGITAHVYADTFAHYGFSGVSSRENRIVGNTIKLVQDQGVVESIMGKTFANWISNHGKLLTNIRSAISGLAEAYSGSLGHGGVSLYPDLPFLQWEFTYENGVVSTHDNQATYLECAEKLYNMFAEYAKAWPDHAGLTTVPFSLIKNKLIWIYAQESNTDDRVDIWQAASTDGDFGVSEIIPLYDKDYWNNQSEDLEDLDEGADAIELEMYKFYCAASYHSHYVLRELLPSHGLLVI